MPRRKIEDRYRVPRLITTRAFVKRTELLRQTDEELGQFEELRQYLGLARIIRSRVLEDEGPNQEAAMEIAVTEAEERERRTVRTELAKTLKVRLTEEVKIRLRDEVIESESPRIEAEVSQQVMIEEPQFRSRIKKEIEQELRRLKREELFERIKTHEAAETLRRFGEITLRDEKRKLCIAEIKEKANTYHYVQIDDIPIDSVLVLGLGRAVEVDRYSSDHLRYVDRVLKLRVLEAASGLFEVIDDSWNDHPDVLRKHHAIEDLSLIKVAPNATGVPPRISVGAEPRFTDHSGREVEMFELEVNVVMLDKSVIFSTRA